jgi:hypothetical protein
MNCGSAEARKGDLTFLRKKKEWLNFSNFQKILHLGKEMMKAAEEMVAVSQG